MTVYQFKGNPNANLSGTIGDTGFDINSGPPYNYFVCNGGTSWTAYNVSGLPSGAWVGVYTVTSGTNPNAYNWAVMPNGYTFAIQNIKSVSVLGNSVHLEGVDGNVVDYYAMNPGYAASLVASIQAVMANPAASTNITGTQPMVWTSIALNSVAHTVNNNYFNISGSGFLASGITRMAIMTPNLVPAIFDANPNLEYPQSDGLLTIAFDTIITFSNFTYALVWISYPAVFPIYYWDSSANIWVAAGSLTITST